MAYLCRSCQFVFPMQQILKSSRERARESHLLLYGCVFALAARDIIIIVITAKPNPFFLHLQWVVLDLVSSGCSAAAIAKQLRADRKWQPWQEDVLQ